MAMPRRHLSVDELTSRASTSLAIRRGRLKISDPIPTTFVHDSISARARGSRDGYVDPNHGGNNNHEFLQRETWHASNDLMTAPSEPEDAPSVAVSNTYRTLTAGPPKQSPSQGSNTGFKRTLKRMFSSRKGTAHQGKGTNISDSGRLPSSTSVSHGSSVLLPTTRARSVLLPSTALHSHTVMPDIPVWARPELSQQSQPSHVSTRRNTEPDLQPAAVNQSSRHALSPALASASRLESRRQRSSPEQRQLRRKSRSADDVSSHHRPMPRIPPEHERVRNSLERRNTSTQSLVQEKSCSQEIPQRQKENNEDSDVPTAGNEAPSLESGASCPRFADQTKGPRVPVEERLNTLEIKLVDFEYALANLYGASLTKANLQVVVSSARSQGQTSTVGDSASSVSNLSGFHRAESQRTEKRSGSPEVRQLESQAPARSFSPPQGNISQANYQKLLDKIQAEKACRELLEGKLIALQAEIQALRSSQNTYLQQSDYPTPNSEPLSKTAVTPRRGLHRIGRMSNVRRFEETSRFSDTETESESDEEDSPGLASTPEFDSFNFDTMSRTHGDMF